MAGSARKNLIKRRRFIAHGCRINFKLASTLASRPLSMFSLVGIQKHKKHGIYVN
jgi:hypothetical protein